MCTIISTPLKKYMCQLGLLFHVSGKIKVMFQSPPTRYMYISIYMFNILVEFTFAHMMFNTIHSPKTKATTAPLGMQGIPSRNKYQEQTRWANGEWRLPPGTYMVRRSARAVHGVDMI